MKKVLLALCGLGLAASAPFASAQITTAQFVPVQYYVPPPIYRCNADNGYGSWGVGDASSPDAACNAALRFCAQNAPVGTVCVVRGWIRIQ